MHIEGAQIDSTEATDRAPHPNAAPSERPASEPLVWQAGQVSPSETTEQSDPVRGTRGGDTRIREEQTSGAPPEIGMSPEDALTDVPIRMYSANWCGVCRKARAFMAKNGIRYTEYDVEHDAAAKARASELRPDGGIPLIQVDGQLLVGFSPDSFARVLEQAIVRRTKRPVQISFAD